MTTIILTRHGQTEWNKVERFRGQADIPLDEAGLEQAVATGKRIANEWHPAAVYASPLARTVRTAQDIARRLDLQVQTEPGLIDINYGEWTGLTPEEVRQRWPELIAAWYQHPETVHIPGGETLEQLRQRGMQTINQLIAHHPQETIAVVGHTAINRTIILGALRLGNERFWHIEQDNCAINVIKAESGDFTIALINDTSHLKSL